MSALEPEEVNKTANPSCHLTYVYGEASISSHAHPSRIQSRLKRSPCWSDGSLEDGRGLGRPAEAPEAATVAVHAAQEGAIVDRAPGQDPVKTASTHTTPDATTASMPTPFVLEVSGANKRFGETVALDGITLRVHQEEWVGLLGPNGAGKTTLVRAIAGRVRLDSGRVTIALDTAAPAAAGRSFGLVPQENALYPFMTARENLEVFGALHGVRGVTLRERAEWALDWAGLVERADEPVGGYSGGMKRRLNLACGVLQRPHLVLLDEPTTGVDPQSRERIFAMLDELRSAGAALLHTTHQLSEAEGVCTRVVIIDRGRIVAEGTPDELVERTLGRLPEVIVTLDRPPAPEALPEGVAIQDLEIHAPSLDDVFLAKTGRRLEGAAAEAEEADTGEREAVTA